MDSDYTIVCDGGCNGNPGPMYGSYRIATKNGKARIERCHFPIGTNNQAEYLSLVTALGDILARCDHANVPVGKFSVSILSDSQLIVKQLQGEWSCNNGELAELKKRAEDHLRRFGRWSIEWRPRQEIVKVLGH